MGVKNKLCGFIIREEKKKKKKHDSVFAGKSSSKFQRLPLPPPARNGGRQLQQELRATGCRGPGPQRLSGPPPLHPGSAPNPNLDPLSGLSLYSSELKWLNQEQADSQLGLCCQLELDPCRTGDAHSLSTQATLACLFLFAAFT